MSKPYVSGDVVIKFHGGTLRTDWIRARRLFDACRQLDGLEAAEPLSVDGTNETITYRRVQQLIPYLPHVLEDPRRARAAGRLLAELHHVDVDNTEESRRHANRWLNGLGVLHEDIQKISSLFNRGLVLTDCWHGNIFWKPDGTLVVLDPLPVLPNLKLTPFYAYGVVDIAMLHMSHFFYHGIMRSVLTAPHRRYAECAHELIASYSQETRCDPRLITRVSSQIAANHIRFYRHRLWAPLATIKTQAASRIFKSIYGTSKNDQPTLL